MEYKNISAFHCTIDDVKNTFKKWQLDSRMYPDNYASQEEVLLQSVDEIATQNTESFMKWLFKDK